MSDTTQVPTPLEVSSASSWKQKSGAGAPLRVPSGNVCLVRPVDLQVLLRRKFIPNSLMDVVTGAMQKKQAPQVDEMTKDLDEERLVEVLQAMDDIVIFVVVEPKIAPVPAVDEKGQEVEPRDEDVLYVDEVDYEDKTFIFQYAMGGTRDIERFRAGFGDYLDSMAEESGVELSTE